MTKSFSLKVIESFTEEDRTVLLKSLTRLNNLIYQLENSKCI